MTKLIRSILFIVASGFGVTNTIAQCTCAPTYRDITPHNEFKHADVVVIGEVLEIKKTDVDEKTRDYTEIVTFKVKKVWKKDIDSVVTIRNRIDFCFNGFRVKEDWLLYVYKNEDGSLGTLCCCSRTRPLSKAADDLREFEAKSEMPATILIRKQSDK